MATSSSGSASDGVYLSLAIVGGISMSAAQLPQIYKVTTRKSTRDISYMYQACYVGATSMYCIFYGYYEVWELFYPCLFCLFCTCYLVVFKTYIERLTPKEAATDGRLRDPEGKAVALLSSRENSSSSFKAEGGDDWTMRDS